ncbi:NAD(P)-dependent oxidoreductase [soil metagenome]
MRIAVTGASGFIGGVIASALAMPEFGHEVIGYGRTPGGWSYRSHVANASHYRIWDVARGRLTSETTVDAVVHCAALADDWAPLAEAMRVNRDGTRNVVRSFPDTRIVHLSTSSVYDAFRPTVNAEESAAPAGRFLSSYSQSKAAAEAELIGTDAVILRPHAVYGPGDTTLLPRLLAGIRRGRLTLPEGAAVHHTLTHIDNLVAAVILALDPDAPAGVYNVGDDEPVLLSAVVAELLAKKGLSDVSLHRIPYGTAFALASAVELAHRVGGRGRPRVTRYAVSQLGLERTLDLSAARTRLGYRPRPTSLEGAERW